ncbi:hypothetical protein FB45DRAFT_268106 [Roridomyces roridus]|uniref:Uncharacterized protein n=1 Tax=Roridomyces roridus TaxID=1738132 RepID=A0AAD7B8X4_9AGAR|nr:hypothetical protein FB45DRAFT_268106 [Roridomyces roridus]
MFPLGNTFRSPPNTGLASTPLPNQLATSPLEGRDQNRRRIERERFLDFTVRRELRVQLNPNSGFTVKWDIAFPRSNDKFDVVHPARSRQIHSEQESGGEGRLAWWDVIGRCSRRIQDGGKVCLFYEIYRALYTTQSTAAQYYSHYGVVVF